MISGGLAANWGLELMRMATNKKSDKANQWSAEELGTLIRYGSEKSASELAKMLKGRTTYMIAGKLGQMQKMGLITGDLAQRPPRKSPSKINKELNEQKIHRDSVIEEVEWHANHASIYQASRLTILKGLETARDIPLEHYWSGRFWRVATWVKFFHSRGLHYINKTPDSANCRGLLSSVN